MQDRGFAVAELAGRGSAAFVHSSAQSFVNMLVIVDEEHEMRVEEAFVLLFDQLAFRHTSESLIQLIID